MSVFKRIAANTFIASLARIIDTVLALILVGLLTRHLGKEGYGYYVTIIAYVHIFITFTNLGLYNILLRDIGKPGANEQKLVSCAFSLRLLIAIIIIPFSILIAHTFPYPPLLRVGISIAALSTFFLTLYQVLIPVFQKHLKIFYVSLAELANRLIYVGLAALLIVRSEASLIKIIWAMVFASFINFILVFIFSKKFTRVRLSFDIKSWKAMLREALPIGASLIFTLIYFRIDTVMLSFLKPPEDVGIYGLSYKILENLIFFPAMFVGFVVPVLSHAYVDNRDRFKQIFQKTFDVITIAIVPLIIGSILAARPIIFLLGGEEFGPSAFVLKILSGAIGLIFFASLYSQIAIIAKKQLSAMWVYAFGALLNILANLYFIPRYSYTGAAITTLITELTITLSLVLIAFRIIRFLPNWHILPRALLSSLPMAIFLYYFNNINVLMLVASSIVIYIIFIYLLGGLNKKDFGFLFKP